MPRLASDPSSVHISTFVAPEELERAFDETRSKQWERLLVVREEVLKAMEPVRAAKTISSGLEAKITLATTGDLLASLKNYAKFLPGLFIVSQVEVVDSAAGDQAGAVASAVLPGLKILVVRAEGKKCDRCWNFSTHVGESADFPTVCERCVAALQEIERTTGLPVGSSKA